MVIHTLRRPRTSTDACQCNDHAYEVFLAPADEAVNTNEVCEVLADVAAVAADEVCNANVGETLTLDNSPFEFEKTNLQGLTFVLA